jgi:CBS domain-containing protein
VRHSAGSDALPTPGETLAQLKALITGASPDEAKSLRRLLFDPPPTPPGGVERGMVTVLPVVSDGQKLEGMVTSTDLIRYLLDLF